MSIPFYHVRYAPHSLLTALDVVLHYFWSKRTYYEAPHLVILSVTYFFLPQTRSQELESKISFHDVAACYPLNATSHQHVDVTTMPHKKKDDKKSIKIFEVTSQ